MYRLIGKYIYVLNLLQNGLFPNHTQPNTSNNQYNQRQITTNKQVPTKLPNINYTITYNNCHYTNDSNVT